MKTPARKPSSPPNRTARVRLLPQETPPAVPAAAAAPPPPPPIVSLTTDIGWAYAAQMKAVLLRAHPDLHIVDVTHEVGSHQILEGAFLLRYTCPWFPPRSIHLGIVDPGVGGKRNPLAITCADGCTLLGPDNGLLSPLAEYLGDPRAFRLEPEKVARGSPVSSTFEGRDLFARAAGLLAGGTPASELGSPVDFMHLRIPAPSAISGGFSAMVLHVDHFGNLITNLPASDAREELGAPGETIAVTADGRTFRATVSRTYEEIPTGALGALESSFGFVELSVSRGRARDLLGLRVNSRFEIRRR